jgi:hypothetical protein
MERELNIYFEFFRKNRRIKYKIKCKNYLLKLKILKKN